MQSIEEFVDAIDTDIAGALERKGFTSLTPVQQAVLDPAFAGRDLRISSQTGSGKTVAIGLAIRDFVKASPAPKVRTDFSEREVKTAKPYALVVAPTRELAKQVEEELSWLYAGRGAKVAVVTGGGGYRDELRAFRASPSIVVGTPGRLLDHLNRKSIDASLVGAVVLDEADRMLDMGFREDIEAIFSFVPEERRTHLVSATFPREVKALADRVQKSPAMVEGTPLGAANSDIDHVIHVVRPDERVAAIVNLLLATRGAQTLIFARTRADVADLAGALQDEGFVVGALSGEMEQAERNRALSSFKRGNLDALVATDVAARGIDVQDIARVIHAEPPSDPDAYTHRSGRTGRAGKKGTSSLLVGPMGVRKTASLLERARVKFRFEALPTARTIRESMDERIFTALTADTVEDPQNEPDERAFHLAKRIAETGHTTVALARLIARDRGVGGIEPREITPLEAPVLKTWRREGGPEPRGDRDGGHEPRGRSRGPAREGSYASFRVSWGQIHGADPRRLLAMACRRGAIDGRDVGAIRVARTFSVVEVATFAADNFERATREPDPRDPRITIRRWQEGAPEGERFEGRPPPREPRHDGPRDAPPGRPYERAPAPPPRIPEERPSVKAVAKDRPSSKGMPKDTPSSRTVPKERPSRAVPKDRPSVPKDRPSVPKDRPSVPKDRPSVPKDRPSRPAKDSPPPRPVVRDTRAPDKREAPRGDRPAGPKPGGAPKKDRWRSAGGHGPLKRKRDR